MRRWRRGKRERRGYPSKQPALRTNLVFVTAENDTGASQPATTARKGYDEQQLAAAITIAEEDRDDETPNILRDITKPNIPRNAENLVPQSLDPAYERPDAGSATGICNALIAKQETGEVGRATTPWHQRHEKKILGGFGYATTDQVLV